MTKILFNSKLQLAILIILFLSQNTYAQISTPQTGSINGKVWVDKNENSRLDDDETGFEGVQIELYKDLKLVASTITSANGSYQFLGLDKGTYRIIVLDSSIPPFFEFSPISNSIWFENNLPFDEDKDSDINTVTGVSTSNYLDPSDLKFKDLKVDAGIIFKPYSFEGIIWNDSNNNGLIDEENKGESNVKVYLNEPFTGKRLDSTYTDIYGQYKFDSLIEGNYNISVIAPFQKYFPFNNLKVKEIAGSNFFIRKNTGESKIKLFNASLVFDSLDLLGAIEGIVWEDVNQNGVRDFGEKPIKGIKLILMNSDFSAKGIFETDENGKYYFGRLVNDTYNVFITLPKSYTTGLSVAVSDTLNSDFISILLRTNNIVINNEAGGQEKNRKHIDAGIFKSSQFGSLGGKVWNDNNNDGWISNNEQGISNVPIYLTNGNLNYIDTTYTNPDGTYLFDGLASGFYRIVVHSPYGTTFSIPNDGFSSSDSDIAILAKDKTIWVSNLTLEIEASAPLGSVLRDVRNVDIGIVLDTIRASLGGKIYEDLNFNFLNDDFDLPFRQVSIELLKSKDLSIVSNTITDTDGLFRFDNIPAGVYKIKILYPCVFDICEIDSVLSFEVIFFEDENNILNDKLDLNYGLFKTLGTINGFVWKDYTKTGILTNDVISNLKIYLLDLNNNKLDSTNTNANGEYMFDNIPTGKYLVKFDMPGYIATTQYVHNYKFDSDIDSTGKTFILTIDNSKKYGDFQKNIPYINAGYIPTGQIGINAWKDSNGNGIREESELPIRDFNVFLYGEIGLLNVYFTDSTGQYVFDNIEPGKYKVKVDFPIDYVPTLLNKGIDDYVDSDIDIETGYTQEIEILPNNTLNKILSIGAGFISANPKGSIGDYVWIDANNNGLQEDTEAGAENIIIQLYENNLLVNSDSTNASGYYSFDNLESGTYKVKILGSSIPQNLGISTFAKQGIDTTLDSDINADTFDSDNIIIDLNNISIKNRTDIDVALAFNYSNCTTLPCVPITVKKMP